MRILLKISGEALQNGKDVGTDHEYVHKICEKICDIVEKGNEVVIVNGGGNICRGEEFAAHGIAPNTAHGIGMLSTVINAIILQDAIISQGTKCNLYTARLVSTIGDVFDARKAKSDLEHGKVIICAGGTGNPYFTTDTASALRSIELECDMMIKCTNVDYLYDKDPKKFTDATPIKSTTYQDILEKNLRVMDQTALALAKDHNLPMGICHIDNLSQIGDFDEKSFVGTLVS